MHNVMRTLLCEKQLSCTVIDTTELVQKGISLHNARGSAAVLFGKALSITAFMSACLKEQKGQISLALQTDGRGGSMGISGNHDLHIRGYIEHPQATGTERDLLGSDGSLTVIREDGYSRPFVGSCALPQNADMDGLVEEYYRVSEQLPTRICTTVCINEEGECLFAGVIALQPLPFADKESLHFYEETDLSALLSRVQAEGADTLMTELAEGEEIQSALAVYRCNCSREYLLEVLVTLGERELREIVQSEGEVRMHCHYCNTDYEFTEKDIDKLFGTHERKKDTKN